MVLFVIIKYLELRSAKKAAIHVSCPLLVTLSLTIFFSVSSLYFLFFFSDRVSGLI